MAEEEQGKAPRGEFGNQEYPTVMITIAGKYGTGKTAIARIISNALLQYGVTATVVSMDRLPHVVPDNCLKTLGLNAVIEVTQLHKDWVSVDSHDSLGHPVPRTQPQKEEEEKEEHSCPMCSADVQRLYIVAQKCCEKSEYMRRYWSLESCNKLIDKMIDLREAVQDAAPMFEAHFNVRSGKAAPKAATGLRTKEEIEAMTQRLNNAQFPADIANEHMLNSHLLKVAANTAADALKWATGKSRSIAIANLADVFQMLQEDKEGRVAE